MVKSKRNKIIPDCDGDIPVTLYLNSKIINSSKALAKKAGHSFEQYMFLTLSSRFDIRDALMELAVFKNRAVSLLEAAQIIIALIRAEAVREKRGSGAGLAGTQAIQYALSHLKEYQRGPVSVSRAVAILCEAVNEKAAREQPTKE